MHAWNRIGPALAVLSLSLAGSANAAPDLSVYGSLPGFERASISPSGDRIAIVGTLRGERMLAIVASDKSLVAKINLTPETKVWSISWAGDDLVLLERSNTVRLDMMYTADRAELSAMTIIPLNGGASWNAFDRSAAVEGGIRGFYGLSHRGEKWYGYFGGMTLDTPTRSGQTYRTSSKPVLYELDLQNHNVRKVADRVSDQHDSRQWLVDADGRVSGWLDVIAGSGNWKIIGAKGHQIASGNAPFGDIRLIGFGNAPGTMVYAASSTDTGETHVFQIPPEGGEPVDLGGGDLIRAGMVDHMHRLIGYEIDDDRPSYRLFDPHRTKVAAAVQKAFPDSTAHLVDWNMAFDRLIVRTEGNGDPQTWWLVDVSSGKATQIGSSYEVAPSQVGPVKMVRYKAGDGTDLSGVLTLPPGRVASRLPVVIFPHGGPAARDYPGFNWWAQAFASRGYAVFQPNFRGSTGYGAVFERAGHRQWGRAMQTDISDGLAQLAKDGVVDPKRACIMGASYGGYAALAGVTLQQGLYRCAVAVAGVSDVARLVQTDTDESGGNAMMRRSLKEDIGSGRDLSAISPVRFAAKADAPILLIHGKDDTVVHFEQSTAMAAALTKAGKPVEMVTLPQTDHWLTRGDTRLAMLNAAVAFVEKHNPPDGVAK